MNYKIIDIPKINNTKGNIGVVENDTIPFDVKRVYYLFDVPSGAKRGGHAHKKLKQVILAISGSFDVVLKDGKSKEIITLNRPDKGLLIENNIWRIDFWDRKFIHIDLEVVRYVDYLSAPSLS